MGVHPVTTICILVFGFTIGTCEADTFASHSGDNDPTTEDWTEQIGSSWSGFVGPIDDDGTPAWFLNDTSTANSSTYIYSHEISDAEIATGNAQGWVLETRLRVTDAWIGTIDGSPVVAYRDGLISWQMNFIRDSFGQTTVRLYTGVDSGPTHTIVSSDYDTFSLRYDPVGANADLFINGLKVISDYVGEATAQKRVNWGAGSSPATGQGNFKRVTFEVPGVLYGDVNQDGMVNLLDVGPFIDLILGGGFQAEADINQDGGVNLLDVQPFIDLILAP